MEPKKPDKRQQIVQFVKEYNLIISFFYELFFVLLGLILLGYVLDQWLKTTPIFTVVFALLGIFSSIFNLYKRTKRSKS
ncbi:MAG: AtpZ/AtpI family protein [Acholeplasma sp.]|nr:AtpZ/AtpI family protein [Acholeplasma sp.]